MKKATLLCGMLLALTASVVSAAGTNIRWTSCFGLGTGTINKNFACNTNSGSQTMVGSFQIDTPILQSSGQEVVIDLASASATLPAWWQFKAAGSCRQTAMTLNTIGGTTDPNFACIDWANGGATSGFAYTLGARGPNTARVLAALAVDAAALVDLSAGQEYFTFNLIVNNSKTLGAGTLSCAGCATPVCIQFNSVKITTQIPANNRTISGPTAPTSDFCTWQGGGVPVVGNAIGCNAAVPTRNATWGSVKSLYR